MARRRPFSTLRPGATVDLRDTTSVESVAERKEILLGNYSPAWAGGGSYFGGYNSVTTIPGRSWSMQRAVKEGLSRDVYIYRAVKTIALDQSRLRFGIRQGDLLSPDWQLGQELADHPLLPLLNVRANPVELAYQLRERTSMIWMLSPRGGFIEVEQTKGGKPTALKLLPTMRTRVVPVKQTTGSKTAGDIDHFEVAPPFGMGKPRTLEPDQVVWFREPHPDDPYAGLTALEAAGLDIEVDYFARLFNRQFLANDGRPGGVIATTNPNGQKDMADEDELERIERKLGGGPTDAGRWVVLDGTVTMVDTSGSPRDAQWQQARQTSKLNELGALGVPESVALMNATNSTFANSGQEWTNYWVHTQVPHADAFALLWLDRVKGGVPFLDYSRVEALQGPVQQRRAEMRDEVQQGARTPKSYGLAVGLKVGNGPDDDMPDVPATRSLWLEGGKVPVAATTEDQDEVGKLAPLGSAPPPAADGAPAGAGGEDPFADLPAEYGGGSNGSGGNGTGAYDTNLKAIVAARVAERRRNGMKALIGAARRGQIREPDDEEDHRAVRVEADLRRALNKTVNALVADTLKALTSQRVRAGTRHSFTAGGQGKALNPDDVVDAQAWEDQTARTAAPYVAAATAAQQQATQQQLEADADPNDPVLDVLAGVAAAAVGAAPVAIPGLTAAQALAVSPLVAGEVARLVSWLAASGRNRGLELAAVIAEADAEDAARVAAGGASTGTEGIAAAVRKWASGLRGWLDKVAPTSAQQAVEAGKHAVLGRLGDRVERWWLSKRDEKVRPAHKAADGQVQAAGSPFEVGGELLRYPRDPLGSPGNVINCRCRTRWRLRREQKALELGPFDVVAAVLEVKAKPRHVRTPAGVRVFHLPVGSPIEAHAAARAAHRIAAEARHEGRRDHVAEIVAQRAPKDRLPKDLADRVAAVRAEYGWTAAETAGWPARAVDYYADDGEFMVLDDRGVPHYGEHGAAGALLRNVDGHGTTRYLLQRRSGLVQHGGTWSTPGGALHAGETPAVGAAREVAEELGADPSSLRHVATHTADMGGWAYHTVILDAPDRDALAATADASGGWESDGVGWFTPAEVAGLELHPGFAASWAQVQGEAVDAPDVAPVGDLADAYEAMIHLFDDPPAAAPGDTARAKADLEAQHKTALDLIDQGWEPEKAAREYARLLNNLRDKYRRDRVKASKAAGGKADKAVADDVAAGPPKTTPADVAEELLKDPAQVDLDKALADVAGAQPRALYSIIGGGVPWETWKVGTPGDGLLVHPVVHAPADKPGPGAVRSDEQWFDKLTADTTEPVPVVGLAIPRSGYVVAHGWAVRRDGVAYLVETDEAVPADDPAVTARLEVARKVYEAVLGGVPGGLGGRQRGVALLNGANPRDPYWAEKYGMPGFTSGATSGFGASNYWTGLAPTPGMAAHELGHNVDAVNASGFSARLSDAHAPVLPGQTLTWEQAVGNDATTQLAWIDDEQGVAHTDLAGRFVETRRGGAHAITAGRQNPTSYAGAAAHEDFAESVRLYLKDRREGKLGYVEPEAGATALGQHGTDVRFVDMWPERAQILDALFGVTSDTQTDFRKQQYGAAVEAVAEDPSAFTTSVAGTTDQATAIQAVMSKFGLPRPESQVAVHAGLAKWKAEQLEDQKVAAFDHLVEQWQGMSLPADPGEGDFQDTVVGPTVADLEDLWGLSEEDAHEVIGKAFAAVQAQQDALEQSEAAAEAEQEIAKAQAKIGNVEDLPKDVLARIRHSRTDVKSRAKKKGATPEEAEALAAAWESNAIAKALAKLGLGSGETTATTKAGQTVTVKGAGADAVHPTWDESLQQRASAFVTGSGLVVVPGAEKQAGEAQQAKANIAATLADMLNNEQDWETLREYRNSGAHVNHYHSSSSGTVLNPHVDDGGEAFHKYATAAPGSYGYYNKPFGDITWVPAFADTTEEERQKFLDQECSVRVGTWAATSKDAHVFAVMLQRAAAERFGLPGSWSSRSGKKTLEEVEVRYPHVEAFYKRFLTAMYDHTQSELHKAGLDWVPVYRGMRVNRTTVKKPHWSQRGVHEVPLQPLSSFAAELSTARSFSGGKMLMRGMVHRSQVLGCARTGLGCRGEYEFVVMAPQPGALWQVAQGGGGYSYGWTPDFPDAPKD